jgi:ankyrin repeat protein
MAVNRAVKPLWNSTEPISAVELLVEAGAHINVKSGPYNTSPLQIAITEKHVELVEILLKSGSIASYSSSNQDFPNPTLIMAVSHGDSKLVEKLLKAKPPLNLLAPPEMITHLQDATTGGDIDTVQFLLDVGSDVNAPAGTTYEAARKADVNSHNFGSLQSPVQNAAANGKTEMVQVLLEAGAGVDGSIFSLQEFLACQSTVNDVKSDIDHMVSGDFFYGEYTDIIYCKNIPMIPLQFAVVVEDVVLVRILLQAGAHVEGRGLGPTPPQLAALKDNMQIVQVLLKKGAAVNSPAHGFGGKLHYKQLYSGTTPFSSRL